jgi:hypothetical protein
MLKEAGYVFIIAGLRERDPGLSAGGPRREPFFRTGRE